MFTGTAEGTHCKEVAEFSPGASRLRFLRPPCMDTRASLVPSLTQRSEKESFGKINATFTGLCALERLGTSS